MAATLSKLLSVSYTMVFMLSCETVASEHWGSSLLIQVAVSALAVSAASMRCPRDFVILKNNLSRKNGAYVCLADTTRMLADRSTVSIVVKMAPHVRQWRLRHVWRVRF